MNEWRTWYWRRCKSEENRSALFLLPDIGCGAHENVVEQKEASLLSFDDFTAVAVDGLDHVVRTDQVAAAVTQKLKDQTVKCLDAVQGGEISAVQHAAQPDWGEHVSIQQRLQMHQYQQGNWCPLSLMSVWWSMVSRYEYAHWAMNQSGSDANLVKVAFVHGLCDVTDLASLVSFPLFFVKLLRQGLQFGQCHLQGQPVCMTDRCVLQHVLVKHCILSFNLC